MAERVLNWLSDYVAADQKIIGIKEVNTRVDALRKMFRERDNLNADQLKEVMTTAHFATYFADALSRMFYKRYEFKVGSWRNYTFPDQAPDFRDVKRFRMSEPGTLHLRREKAESKATHIEATKIQYGVDEYSRQFDVSWHAIMNDDLGEIKKTPENMADAAGRFEDIFVSALYDNAVTQATLAALGAPWSGTGRLTAANLAVGINAMAVRTDINGNQMNISKIHLVVPTVLRIQAGVILRSELMAGVATNDKNILDEFIVGVHKDPYIATAGINVPWYLFADPSEVPTVTVARMNGFDGPWTYKKKSDIEPMSGSSPAPFMMGSFATGDIEYGVSDIIGGWADASYVGVTDFRGLYYSSGTTP